MPTKKDGAAGQIQAPADPVEALDSLQGQSGASEDAAAPPPDRGSQTVTLSSAVASAEKVAGSSDELDDAAT